MKSIFNLICFLTAFSTFAQTINGDLKNATFLSHNGDMYVYNLEKGKIFHIKKYSRNLEVVAEYTKELQEKVYDGLMKVKFQEKDIFIVFQTGKIKMGFKYKPVPGFRLLLNYDLKETESEKLDDIGANAQVSNNYAKQYSDVPLDQNRSYNSFDSEVFEKDVLQKNNIEDIGKMISVANDLNKGQTFQIANFKDDESERSYNGFYVLTEEGGKVIMFKKFDFLGFENVNKEKKSYMEFFPGQVKNTKNSFLIPFIQRVHRKEAHTSNSGGVTSSTSVDVYYIIGTGVIEVKKADGSIQTNFFDRKGISQNLKYEHLVDFEATSIKQYGILLHNWPTYNNVIKSESWGLHSSTGEKFQEKDKDASYEIIEGESYIKFEPNKSGYTLSKVAY